MDTLVITLFVLFIVLAVITLVGHGIWVLLSVVFRGLFPDTDAGPDRPQRHSSEDTLAGLETTQRVLARLVAAGLVDADTARPVQEALAQHRHALLSQQTPSMTPAHERLVALVQGATEPVQLSLQIRQLALTLLRSLRQHELELLPPTVLLVSARLLRQAGLASRAVALYQMLLNRHPAYTDRGTIALEAGRLALAEQMPQQARDLLEIALRSGPIAEKDAARRLLHQLDEADVPIATVIPVTAEDVIPAAPAEEVLDAVAVEPPPVEPMVEVAAPAQAVVIAPPSAPPAPPPLVVQPPPPPRRRLRDLLGSFMEEKNILWGELAGGLLIVGCSIALVATLWQDLRGLPYFPFLIFSAVTAALFGAGEYTLHHWKLETTSRGLLLISLLMIPLNLLILTSNPAGDDSGGLLEPLVRGGGVLLAAGLIWVAGRDLIGTHTLPGPIDRRWLLTLSLAGGSASVLFLPGLLGLEVLIWLPVVCHGLTLAAVLAGLLRAQQRGAALQDRQAGALLAFTGLASFAVAVVLGFLLLNHSFLRERLFHLALPLDLLGVPLLFVGLLVHQLPPRSTAPTAETAVEAPPAGEEPPAPFSIPALHLWGTGIGLVGIVGLFASLLLAWPHWLPLLVICLLNGVLLTVIAFRWQLPAAHGFAIPSLVGAILLLIHPPAVLGAEITAVQVPRLLLTFRTALPLILLAWACVGLAEWLFHRALPAHGRAYARAAEILTLLALGAASFHGLEHPLLAACVFCLAGLLALAPSQLAQRLGQAHLGLGLLVAASLWSLQALASGQLSLWALTLAGETVLLAVAVCFLSQRLFGRAARDMALTTGVLALVLALVAPGVLTPHLPLPTGTIALLALAAFVLATGTGWIPLGWIGSALSLAALLRLFRLDLTGASLLYPELTALLTHAALALLSGRIFARVGPHLSAPLHRSAQAVSLVASVWLFFWEPAGSFFLAGHALGLGLLWLALAWLDRAPWWFTAFQAGITLAVVFTVRALLGTQSSFALPSLYTYGAALAALELGWITARGLLRKHERISELFSLARPPVDRVMVALLTVGHLLLALLLAAPGAVAELTPAHLQPAITAMFPSTAGYSLPAALFLALLAVALLAALREHAGTPGLLGLLALALSIPLLTAAPWDIVNATASALRWHLSLAFLVCGVLVWMRIPLQRLVRSAGISWPEARSDALLPCHFILGIAAAIVLALTLIPSGMRLAGQVPAGPGADSLFAEMGPHLSYAVPLLLLVAGFVGHSLRERAPGYAFSAGLLINLIVSGGYVLGLALAGQTFDEVHAVRLVQLAGLTASLWALVLAGWDRLHRYLDTRPARDYLVVQIALGLIGCLLLPIVVLLQRDFYFGPAPDWIPDVGSLLGWLALLAAFAALAVGHERFRQPVSWAWLFIAGLTATAVLACTLERHGAGPLTLALAWPLHSLAWVSLGWATARSPTLSARLRGLSLAGLAEYSLVLIAPCLVSTWAVVAMVQDVHRLPASAVSLGLTAAALAVLALWQRRDEAALVAGVAFTGAVSLLTVHARAGSPVVFEIDVVAWSAWVLAWLAARRALPGWPMTSPALILSAPLAFLANTLILLAPLGLLYTDPVNPLSGPLARLGEPLGWLTCLAATAAFCAFLAPRPAGRLHVLAVAGLQAGILAACAVTPWNTVGSWLSFHVLLLSWCSLALLAIAGGSVAFALEQAQLSAPPGWLSSLLPLRLRSLAHWMEGITAALFLLALRSLDGDPWQPYSAVIVLLIASVQMAALALWRQREYHVWASGFFLAAVPLVCWLSWGQSTLASFLLVTALGLAGASAIWSAIELSPLRRPRLVLPPLAFSSCAAWLALSLVALAALITLTNELPFSIVGVPVELLTPVLLLTAVAFLLLMWEPRGRAALPGLYLLGLVTLTFGVYAQGPGWIDRGWYAALALAGYVSLAGSLHGLLARLPQLPALLHLPQRDRPAAENWLTSAQLIVGALALCLSVWIAVEMPTLAARLAGPAAVLLLLPACLLLPGSPWRRTLTLIVAALVFAELAWACPAIQLAGVWLERNALLLLALAGLTAAYGLALPQWLAHRRDWVQAGRQLAVSLGGLALATLVVVLLQELAAFDRETKRTSLHAVGVCSVLAALLVLMTVSLIFAVAAQRDPLGLSERGRTLYVYLLELLLVLTFAHVRLNVPELFGGWAGRYWTLLVMLIAFVGVGLSELLERRRLHVLAEPLQRTGIFLPLLPLVAFWARPPAALLSYSESHAPGLQPFLSYLHRLEQDFSKYALLWMLVSALYALVALSRRSFRFALLAALAGNFALWSLLTYNDIGFALHPQAWLIPLGLIVLAVEHLHRDQLADETATGLRYLGISMIYVASTADLYLTGLGQSLWLPVVLALLSVAGMLWGILVRIRAFLFLGFSFLVVDVLAMIWHAAVHHSQTWVWWACGIVLGIAILALFAVFEKRRQDVLRLIEEIRRWR